MYRKSPVNATTSCSIEKDKTMGKSCTVNERMLFVSGFILHMVVLTCAAQVIQTNLELTKLPFNIQPKKKFLFSNVVCCFTCIDIGYSCSFSLPRVILQAPESFHVVQLLRQQRLSLRCTLTIYIGMYMNVIHVYLYSLQYDSLSVKGLAHDEVYCGYF